ncbi:Thioredoxin reductase [Afipia felis]|uniref:Thioredoxin reductase n=1 Tax=Afipia felis TaxID=1035 RepID=A0A090MHB8_AFIFE|nr:NAD(P)/FAD-dependent oxidoreductase [Afipia felis]CEG06976.1 Thioredoxin reductase [Afipia felis]
MADLQKTDCFVVGAGPAGLTAAVYLGRYLRSVLVADHGRSRARLIPRSHNYPAFPQGVTGEELLQLLREQALRYGAVILPERIVRLSGSDGGFLAESAERQVLAKKVILATGLVDRSIKIPGMNEAVAAGIVRFCPVCDAYEAKDANICVLGSNKDALHKALFMRTYSRTVTLAFPEDKLVDAEISKSAHHAGVNLLAGGIERIRHEKHSITLFLNNGKTASFDVIYPALGCDVRSDLAADLGAKLNEVGCLKVDEHQQTSIEGIYAVGDVVSDLHQLAVGAGHAAIAATHIHKLLDPNFR